MGHYSEKWNEGWSGYGPEQGSDWKIGEDTSPYLQGVRDAGNDDGTTGHSFMGLTFNDRFHKDDQPGGRIHERGNQLAVAFKMMWEGGVNPACYTQGYGCTNVQGANGAPMIMLKTFSVYMTNAEMQWSHIANLAGRAAFDHFNKCHDPWGMIDDAGLEQHAVEGAFANIGYPRTEAFITCQ